MHVLCHLECILDHLDIFEIPKSGIVLTSRQVARGESKTNLANRFLIKFAKTEIFGDSIWENFVTDLQIFKPFSRLSTLQDTVKSR